MPERPPRPASLFVLLAALAGVLLLRIAVMEASGAGLYVDEAQYWDWSRELAWGYWSKPPGIAAIIAASTAIFGDGLFGVRVFSMACWVAAAFALAWTARRASGPTAAVWAAALFVSTPTAGLLGLVATTDGPLVFCWSLAMAFSWRAWSDRERPRSVNAWWMAAGVATGCGLLSKYSMGAIAVSWLVLAWYGGRRTFTGVVLAGVVAALIALPNVLWNAANGWPTLFHTAAITVNSVPATGRSHVGLFAEYVAGQVLSFGPVALGVLAVCMRRAKPMRKVFASGGDAAWFALTFAWPILAIGAVQALHAKAQVNWTAPALLGLCLWLALQADRFIAPVRALQCAAAGVVLAAVLALAGHAQIALTGRDNLDLWARMRGWTEALEALRPSLDALPGLPVVASRRDLISHADYVWRSAHRPVFAWPYPGTPDNHFAQFRPLRHPGEALPQQVLLLAESGPDEAMRAAYPEWSRLASATSGRVTVQLWMGAGRRP
ncbi:MAG TPA: glycosyltransferase family 39 protein [Ramlibacter sp.]|uniref:ArnT family glycosyltransferase n=1 Tax=Ramlibacter sp. TaxID=1917967 RepID=UPI002C59FAFF|nr:glycosyltransferase family 39 protein [Ramlibacter sp.]HVZ44670.1 glycosyltransferase family 39 protein [Ramlibacter sp.]